MAGNTVYVQGSYVDVHDNEVVNLSIDKAGKVQVGRNGETNEVVETDEQQRDEERFHFVHPELDDEEGWRIHDVVKRLVEHQGLQEICRYLSQLGKDNKILLPQNAEKMYDELVRMGMSNGEGYNLKTFMKYYTR